SAQRGLEGGAARLAAWAAEGRVEAVQLELGGALRWPGPRREAFSDAVVETYRPSLKGSPLDPSPLEAPPGSHDESEGSPSGIGLQADDAAAGRAGLGIIAGLGVMNDGRSGARLLFLPGGQELVLFTGEERRAPGGRVGGLEIRRGPGSVALRFRGPALL